jgi:hypothetical protein
MAKLEFLASGKFKQKGDQPRKVRSLRLTDQCWEQLGQIAESQLSTRADLIEDIVKNKLIVNSVPELKEDNQGNIKEIISGLIETLYRSNELEINSKVKACTKRAFEKLLKYLS